MERTIADWLEDLKDRRLIVARCSAARALAAMGPKAKEAVPALVQALSDPEPLVRDAAAAALGSIGAAATEAVPALIEALEDWNGFVRQAAAKALKMIDPDAAAKKGIR
jgi:HEAT repeat protein